MIIEITVQRSTPFYITLKRLPCNLDLATYVFKMEDFIRRTRPAYESALYYLICWRLARRQNINVKNQFKKTLG